MKNVARSLMLVGVVLLCAASIPLLPVRNAIAEQTSFLKSLLRFQVNGTPVTGINTINFSSGSASGGVLSVTTGSSFPLLAPDGTTSAPSYSFASDTKSGLLNAAGAMCWQAANGAGGNADVAISRRSAGAWNIGQSCGDTTGAIVLGTVYYNDMELLGASAGTITGVWSSPRYAVGQDVASSGAGAQSTTIATVASPASGLYRVCIVMSAHTNSDTVSAQVTYTDAIDNTATTLTPISSIALTHDSATLGTTSGCTQLIRASAATAIVAKISTSSQSTTKASASIERLN